MKCPNMYSTEKGRREDVLHRLQFYLLAKTTEMGGGLLLLLLLLFAETSHITEMEEGK